MDRIQDYILDIKEPEEVKDAAPAIRKKQEAAYEIIAKTNSDIVIKRKTRRTESVLAIIPSKGQYYIANDGGEAESLTPDSMAKFFRQLHEPFEVNLDWLKCIEKSKQFADMMLNFVHQYRQAICAGLIDDRLITTPTWYIAPDIVMIYESAPKLALFLKEKSKVVERRLSICLNRYREYQPYACGAFESAGQILYLHPMSLMFGLDKTKLYVEKMIERDLNFGCPVSRFTNLISTLYQDESLYVYDWRNPASTEKAYGELAKQRNEEHLNADAFTSYLLTYQSEGYQNLDSFFQELRDDWMMQRELYGKIREKYPKNLASHHNKLVQKKSMVSNQIDEALFKKQYEVAVLNEWADDKYIIKAPENVGDMVDEATQQCNCLRSYIGDVIDGKTSIYFLRHKKSPEDSLVTVEVKNDRLVQVKGKFNKEPNHEQKQALAKWAAAKKLSYAC